MKHFSRKEWELYRKSFYKEKQLGEMEAHLYECNHCLEIFLSLVDDEEVCNAARSISQDFDDRVMNSVKTMGKHHIQRKQMNNSAAVKNRLITYYVAAAMVTIMLMSAGFFQAIIKQVPTITLSFADKPKTECRVKLDWPAEVVSRTYKWISNFESEKKGGFDFE